METITAISDFLWGYPIIIALLVTSVFLTFRLKFFQFRKPLYIFQQTIGQVGKKSKSTGTITPFQTLTTALSSTIGAANIVGVPVAIMLGGPGALFWMWVIAFLGMALKFGEPHWESIIARKTQSASTSADRCTICKMVLSGQKSVRFSLSGMLSF